MTGIWFSVLIIIFTSALAILTILLIIILLKSLFIVKSPIDLLLKYQRIVYITLTAITIMLVFSLTDGLPLSNNILGKLGREFLISIIYVATFALAWLIVDRPVIVRRIILIGLLRLVLKFWSNQPPLIKSTVTRSTLDVEFFEANYQELRRLLGNRFVKVCLAVCQIATIFSESFLVFYDKCEPVANPAAISIAHSDTEYLHESIKQIKQRMVKYKTEELLAKSQLENL